MPSPNRRLILTVPPSLDEAIDLLSEALDLPRSAVVVNLLQEMEPQLRDLAKYATAVKTNRRSAAKRALQHMVGNALAEQLQLLNDRQKK